MVQVILAALLINLDMLLEQLRRTSLFDDSKLEVLITWYK